MKDVINDVIKKIFRQVVTILLSWSLTITYCVNPLFASNPTPTPAADLKTACQGLTGWAWNYKTNSCQRTVDTRKISTCDTITDVAEKQKCVQDEVLNLPEMNIKEIKADASYDPDKWGGFDSIANFTKLPLAIVHSTFVVGAIAIFLFNKYNSCPTAGSIYVMALGAIVGLATDIGTYFYLKSKLSDLRDTLKADTEANNEGRFIDLQAKTFDTMADAYDKRSQVEMIRAFAYGASAAIFAVATAVALYEAYKPDACVPAKAVADKVADKATDKATTTGAGDLLTPAAVANPNTLPLQAATSAIGKEVFSSNMIWPLLRAGVAGVMTLISVALTYKVYQAYKTSKARRDFIRELKKSIVETQPAFSCTNRNDSAKPSCYCYTEKGERNFSLRSNSDICKKYWASLDNPITAPDSGKYGINDVNAPKASCVTADNQIDPLCKCLDTKDAKGNNSCYKSKNSIASVSTPGTAWAQNLDKLTESLLNGSTPAGKTATPQSLTKLAADINKLTDKKIEESNKEARKLGQAEVVLDKSLIDKNFQELKKIATPELQQKIDNAFGTNLGKLSLTDEGNSKDRGNENAGASSMSRTAPMQFEATGRGKTKEKRGTDFGSGGGGSGDVDAPRVLNNLGGIGSGDNSGLKYDGGINKDSGTQIWDSISYRYQVSGNKRLFGEE